MFFFQNIMARFAPNQSTLKYSKDMKKLVLAAALLLTAMGARSPLPSFGDPIPECPPACSNSGNVVAHAN